MSADRPQKEPLDYLIMSLSPALIMLLVGSLCFFLVHVFYIGDALGSVHWVLFWYVLAVVLISRIGIEQGAGHAMAYGLALAFVTWIYLVRLHPAYLMGAVLLGVVWWFAHKLTYDCTLIDESEDVSGQGLLQIARRKWWQKEKAEPPKPSPKLSGSAAGVRMIAPRPAKAKGVLHPPGIWLIYFSATALPLFGIGQTLLPTGDMAARHGALNYLLVYLGAAFGLLLLTSFLGLRRYLRQRYLPMPGRIALGWLQFGGSMAAIVLVLAFLLPRPGVGTAWKTLGYQVDYQLHRASNYAMRFNAHGQGSGRPGEQGQSPNNPADSHSQSQSSKPESGNKPSPNPSKGQGGDQKDGPGQQQNSSPEHGPSTMPEVSPHLFHALKFLVILVVVGLIGWWCYRRRELLGQIFQSLLAALNQFFQNLFGNRAGDQKPAMSSLSAKPPQFSSYQNPFVTGNDRQWPPQQLIVYSYEALKSWAAERGVDTNPKQTPRELCLRLGEKYTDVGSELSQLAMLYGHAAYGTSVPANYNREAVRNLWAYISVPRAG